MEIASTIIGIVGIAVIFYWIGYLLGMGYDDRLAAKEAKKNEKQRKKDLMDKIEKFLDKDLDDIKK